MARDEVPVSPGIFMEGSENGEIVALRGSECRDCGVISFPPAMVCPSCGGTMLEDRALSHRGRVFVCSKVERGVPNFDVPYYVGYVDLPEGVRVFAPLIDEADQGVREGDLVEWTLRRVLTRGGEERMGYAFVAASGVAESAAGGNG